jgi:diguanylate cyclase (GGDEF)-like protein
MRILVIDDDAGELDFLRHALQELGFEIDIADSGAEGVAMFTRDPPDMVLLDMLMPDMDGLEAARRMRELREAWVPIIFLSGCAASGEIEAAIDAGGDDYLVKPFEIKLLETKIHAMQRIAQMRQKLVEQAAELARLAESDGLTGIANRRRLDTKLSSETNRCARSRLPLSVIMVDIDHFKRFNDAYGHQAGDECLAQVAHTLAAQVHRPSDLVARYGGEEFCVVMPETTAEGAHAIAEQLRQAVAHMSLKTPKGQARMTISLGVASMVPTPVTAPDELVRLADHALYRAKKDGRNTVRVAGGNPAEPLPHAAGPALAAPRATQHS